MARASFLGNAGSCRPGGILALDFLLRLPFNIVNSTPVTRWLHATITRRNSIPSRSQLRRNRILFPSSLSHQPRSFPSFPLSLTVAFLSGHPAFDCDMDTIVNSKMAANVKSLLYMQAHSTSFIHVIRNVHSFLTCLPLPSLGTLKEWFPSANHEDNQGQPAVVMELPLLKLTTTDVVHTMNDLGEIYFGSKSPPCTTTERTHVSNPPASCHLPTSALAQITKHSFWLRPGPQCTMAVLSSSSRRSLSVMKSYAAQSEMNLVNQVAIVSVLFLRLLFILTTIIFIIVYKIQLSIHPPLHLCRLTETSIGGPICCS